jgi:indolepyruvate ferredoxin oxidoreductase
MADFGPSAPGLDSKYELDSGVLLLSGIQALVRLPMVRRQLDTARGWRTAGFISGYRGSPLGGYDLQLAAQKRRLDALDVVVRPAVNEDLAATAIWGTQQVNLYPGARYDGVFGIWYGKTPGVDRSGDALKHANYAGTWARGGVLALAGDDHGAKSSTMAAQSEYAFIDAEMPVFAPSTIAEVLAFGLKAFDLSRHAGLWTAMTVVADLMDSTATLTVELADYASVTPEFDDLPPGGLGIRIPDKPLAQEERHRLHRLPAAAEFVRLNGFDRREIDCPQARFGIVAQGKAYNDVRQAMADLGVDATIAGRLGLRLYKPGLVWPLERTAARAAVGGLEQVLVIEERRPLVEDQLRQLAYDLPDGQRPRIVGKLDEQGRPLVSAVGELDAAQVARAIFARIPPAARTDRMLQHIARLDAAQAPTLVVHERKPLFCPGCPHNTSTQTPEGSRAMAGIGCHYMVQDMDRQTSTFTQMGGEGVSWIGQAPFTDEAHVFANLGDGTYFHSGSLAIRQSVAAGSNITYKILYNDAVAMTGGQAIDGELTVARLVQQLAAEGVSRIEVVSDDVAAAREAAGAPQGIGFHPRSDLDAIQRALREHKGVSALVYVQTCATELRRRRKRGLAPDPGLNIIINERVCEGCGDCSAQSNCIAVEPVETEYGRKRRIDQSACNKDQSCVTGFCPSFVTVKGGRRRKAQVDVAAALVGLPDPTPPALSSRPYNIALAGLGGQGLTSLAAIIDMATYLDGGAAKSADTLGMAQKGGGVFVHLRLADRAEAIHGPRITAAEADLVLANDMVVAHGRNVLPLVADDRTSVILNTTLAPTAEFVAHNDTTYDTATMRRGLAGRARRVLEIEAGRLVGELMGDTIFTNIFLLGHAWQLGLVPLSRASLERAIELNGTQVAANTRAFALGRLAAHDPDFVQRATPARKPVAEGLDAVLATRVADLTAYQDVAYATRYRNAVLELAEAETRWRPGSTELALAAARSLHKLMAYKDEYEVARLHSDSAFHAAIEQAFEGPFKLQAHLAPPLLGRRDATGRPVKSTFGPWMFTAMRWLAPLKLLRGGPLDPFGWTAERRTERALRDEFLQVLKEVAAALGRVPSDDLLELLSAPQAIRGYGHVKTPAVLRYQTELARFRLLGTDPRPARLTAVPSRSLSART